MSRPLFNCIRVFWHQGQCLMIVFLFPRPYLWVHSRQVVTGLALIWKTVFHCTSSELKRHRASQMCPAIWGHVYFNPDVLVCFSATGITMTEATQESAYLAYRLKFITGETKAATQRQELKQRPWRSVVYCFDPIPKFRYFSHEARPIAQGWHCTGQALVHQLVIKKTGVPFSKVCLGINKDQLWHLASRESGRSFFLRYVLGYISPTGSVELPPPNLSLPDIDLLAFGWMYLPKSHQSGWQLWTQVFFKQEVS